MQYHEKQDGRKESITLDSPIGMLVITALDGAICSIGLLKPEDKATAEQTDHPLLNQAAMELKEYFERSRTQFTFPMHAEGTAFQNAVWDALRKIPYGETMSYGEIANVIGNAKASRAVGMACNRNPIMIAVPCHRVVGANGSLTGYAYGTGIKQVLLDIERENR